MLFKEACIQKKDWKVSWREEIAGFAAGSLLLSYILWCAAILACSKNRTCSSCWALLSFQSQLHPVS